MTSRLLRIKMAVAGVLGTTCALCKWPGVWKHETKVGSLEAQANKGQFLQVGHPNGRKWSIRAVNQITRWRRYLKEAIAGKVQAECGPCNRKHGGGLRYPKKDKTRQGAPKRRMGTESNPWPIRQTAHTCWCGDIDCRDHT
jgi:hypothetical protein